MEEGLDSEHEAGQKAAAGVSVTYPAIAAAMTLREDAILVLPLTIL